MRLLVLAASAMLGFVTIVGIGVVGFGVAMTGGGVAPDDLSAVKDGMRKASLSGLKGVEQTAKRLRGDYCAGEQSQTKDADCG